MSTATRVGAWTLLFGSTGSSHYLRFDLFKNLQVIPNLILSQQVTTVHVANSIVLRSGYLVLKAVLYHVNFYRMILTKYFNFNGTVKQKYPFSRCSFYQHLQHSLDMDSILTSLCLW